MESHLNTLSKTQQRHSFSLIIIIIILFYIIARLSSRLKILRYTKKEQNLPSKLSWVKKCLPQTLKMRYKIIWLRELIKVSCLGPTKCLQCVSHPTFHTDSYYAFTMLSPSHNCLIQNLIGGQKDNTYFIQHVLDILTCCFTIFNKNGPILHCTLMCK